ncbi:hypothetical protein AAIB41_17525 [Brucella sp. BE17]|uniref:hypothetical protein n=1 Tax=Brucella sp. BE17 TaxID=3142977 RepID=UPI0031BB9194
MDGDFLLVVKAFWLYLPLPFVTALAIGRYATARTAIFSLSLLLFVLVAMIGFAMLEFKRTPAAIYDSSALLSAFTGYVAFPVFTIFVYGLLIGHGLRRRNTE